MIYQLVVALAIVSSVAAKLFPEDPTQQKYVFEQFKETYSRSYSTMEEETRRFTIFLENLRMADNRNDHERRAGGSAVHGITKFSDMSQAEFESRFLTADASKKQAGAETVKITRPVDTTSGLVDWTGTYTTPVKNQYYCGSCWAFSATEQIESDAIRQLGVTYVLSPEQITQCTTGAFGCSGGWTETAYAYVKKNGGLVTETAYPYTTATKAGVTGTCDTSKTTTGQVITITGYTSLSASTTAATESAMASYVQSTGPLSVCLDASAWNSYTGGIVTSCTTDVDHCVQAVGVDASTGGYWKVRNSWGTDWGESGFIRLAYGANTCAITNDPTYVATKKV